MTMQDADLTNDAAFVSARGHAWSRNGLPYAIYFVLFFALWLALPVFTSKEVPGDNYEQLNWALAPALGYVKHPPFPTWILWLFEQVFPASVMLTYVLGGLQIAFLLTAVWLIAREVLGKERALLAVLLVSCITYYTNRMHFYNHNTALLVATVAAVYVLWRAVRSNAVTWWFLLGVCWGVGMLSKYQMMVTIACNGVYLVSLPPKQRDVWRGVVIAAAVAMLVVLPHAMWLVQNHFPTFTYASKSLGAHAAWMDRPSRCLKFLADQALRLVNLLLVLGAFAFFVRRNAKAPAAAESHEGRRFLAIHAFGPLLFMTLLCVFFGVELQMHWGTAFLWAIPLWILATPWGAKVAMLNERLVLACVVAAQVVMAVGFVLEL